MDEIEKDVGKKTYSQIENEVNDLLKKMNITPETNKELYETVKKTLVDAAYDGLDYGVNDVIAELENRKASNPEKEVSYNNAISAAKNNLNANQLNFYKSSGILDDVDLFNEFVARYQESINAALAVSTEEASVTAMGILQEYSDKAMARAKAIETQAGNYENLSGKLKDEYDYWIQQSQSAVDIIEGIWGSLQMGEDIPWKKLWEDFDEFDHDYYLETPAFIGVALKLYDNDNYHNDLGNGKHLARLESYFNDDLSYGRERVGGWARMMGMTSADGSDLGNHYIYLDEFSYDTFDELKSKLKEKVGKAYDSLGLVW